jgi:23S rRNA (pseudouridine1915-N3)-methyltransferase
VKIAIVCVGRLKEEYWQAAEAEYLKRLRRFATIEIKEAKDDAALAAAIPPRAHVFAMDERGEQLSSEEIARKIIAAEESHGGGAPVAFVIGGAEGLPPAIREGAKRVIAFGRITLPHRIARVVLVEQLYRAYSLLRGEPYHK